MSASDPPTAPTVGAETKKLAAGHPYLPSGLRVGSYVIDRPLGSGGFATVYAAHHVDTLAVVALKVLHPELVSSDVVERFMREVKLVEMTRHPNIIAIQGSGWLGTAPYFVMELVSGETVKVFVSRVGRIPQDEAVVLLRPVCEALNAVHVLGMVHRDLKPSNVMYDPARGTVKLLDFGIAKLVEPAPGEKPLTREGTRIGSTCSMAPEQVLGKKVDTRTDVYALGVFAYYLLTGSYPFAGGEELETMTMHVAAPVPRPSERAPLSPGVESVILKAMEKDPVSRYPSANAFLEAFIAASQEAPLALSYQPKRSIGVYVELSAPSNDDDSMLRVADELSTMERSLEELGLRVLAQPGTRVLGVKVLPDDERDAEALGQELQRRVRELASGYAEMKELRARFCLHLADLHLAADASGGDEAAIVGGPLLDTGRWGTFSAEKPGEVTIIADVSSGQG